MQPAESVWVYYKDYCLMNLFIISGFLGSGKTSLLLTIAKTLTAAGKKIAIIENEIGKVGVDGAMLKSEGLQVKEIFSGCICCSLRHDLIKTLLELEVKFKPDIVLLEPSGVASPRQIPVALSGYSGEISNMKLIVVIDASRFILLLEKLNIPIIFDGLIAADLLVVNKCDLVTDTQLLEINNKVKKLRPDKAILNVSALNEWHTEDLCEMLLNVKNEAVASSPKPLQLQKFNGMDPIVLSRNFNFTLNASSQIELNSSITCMLQNIADLLNLAGCATIGHIKAILKAEEGGYLMFSITDFTNKPGHRGKMSSKARKIEFVLNVIVYGINDDIVKKMVDNQLDILKNSLL